MRLFCLFLQGTVRTPGFMLTKWPPALGTPTMFVAPPPHLIPRELFSTIASPHTAPVIAGSMRLAFEAGDISGR